MCPGPDNHFDDIVDLRSLPAAPDRLHQRAADSPLNERHRLAGSASGTGGTHGNPLLDAAAELLRPSGDPLGNLNPEEYRAWAADLRAAHLAALELEEAAIEYEDAAWRAKVARRRIEKRRDAFRKRAEIEERRAAGGMYAGAKRSPNRPVHVEVDAGAWAVVKSNAVRRRIAVAGAIGQLVTEVVERGLTPAHRSLCRPAQPSARGRRAQRFARLFVDNETWSTFRSLAVDAHMSTARLLGIVVEVEAHGLGWRPEVDR